MGDQPPVLEMRGITKRFPTGTLANDAIDLDVRRGEIHALLGENGAGKSTLMNILYGLVPPDTGQVLIDGRPVTIRDPADAIARGIGMVHQHFMLVPVLSVAENVVLGQEIVRAGGILDLGEATKRIRLLAKKLGFEVEPGSRVDELSVGQQQRIEILKAIYRNARILVLDEPTAVLTPQETREIFGIAGVAGNGQDELVEALIGLRRPIAGAIRVAGRDLTRASVDERRDRGIAFVPADRQRFGLVLTYRLDDNLSLTRYAEVPFAGGFAGIVRDFRSISANAVRLIQEFDVRAAAPSVSAGTLSGGNQQKIVVAREFRHDLKLLVLDQPTRGLDVGSIEFIHKQVIARRDAGVAVLLVSAELDEVLDLSDRVLVMFRGRVVGQFPAEEAQREKVGLLMATGGAGA